MRGPTNVVCGVDLLQYYTLKCTCIKLHRCGVQGHQKRAFTDGRGATELARRTRQRRRDARVPYPFTTLLACFIGGGFCFILHNYCTCITLQTATVLPVYRIGRIVDGSMIRE